ncbi:electron transfer flavoprotein subunit alpha [Oceanisphaera profunda]|uniref:Electron transfer flavoprotein subunit alpha n=1 Tax=Oceanisphaera profunda TaxID=1416627 RepID=A0A1Y0D3B6_9GAMM|nr:FAD-binding protein [Oceanisphaera profunda]ART81999.1 electron transfer flavoprotein subunit alpha [Oceanisphaera profunda]
MTCLLIAEHDNTQLNSATLHALTAATELGGEIDLLIMGDQCQAVAKAAAKFAVRTVLVADAPDYQHQLAEPCAALIESLAKNYLYIVAAATTTGKNLLPRVAALLDVGMVSEVLAIESPDTFRRPIYAGNAITTVQALDDIKLLTVRTTAFASADAGEHGTDSNSAEIKQLAAIEYSTRCHFVSEQLSQSARPELTSARVVISGGRGLGSKENFALLAQLADKLNAAIGATRAAVDAGFAANDMQVGQTGKIVAPELYIAVGLSGAIQHLAGMKESKVIVAINKDADAAIFEVADYGLVADLFEVLPELEKLL